MLSLVKWLLLPHYVLASQVRFPGVMMVGSLQFIIFQNANVSRKADNFKGKKYMVVHGTADGKFTRYERGPMNVNSLDIDDSQSKM